MSYEFSPVNIETAAKATLAMALTAATLGASALRPNDADARPHPDAITSSQSACAVDAGPCFTERIETWRGGRTIVIEVKAENTISYCGALYADIAKRRVVIRKPDAPVTDRGIYRTSKRLSKELGEAVKIQDGSFAPCPNLPDRV